MVFAINNIVLCSTHSYKKSTVHNPTKKHLSSKLKYALQNCNVQTEQYEMNKDTCNVIWDEVDALARQLKDENKDI